MLILVLAIIVAAYAIGLIVLLLKGNKRQIENGVLFAPIWIASAFRLAEPDSWWARNFYDEFQMEQARARSKFRQRDQDASLEPGGASYGVERADAGDIGPEAIECRLCGRVCPSWDDALKHADALHTELPFSDTKAALVKFESASASQAPTRAAERQA